MRRLLARAYRQAKGYVKSAPLQNHDGALARGPRDTRLSFGNTDNTATTWLAHASLLLSPGRVPSNCPRVLGRSLRNLERGPLVDGPHTRRDDFQKIVVGITKVKCLPAVLPGLLLLNRYAHFGEPLFPSGQARTRYAKSNMDGASRVGAESTPLFEQQQHTAITSGHRTEPRRVVETRSRQIYDLEPKHTLVKLSRPGCTFNVKRSLQDSVHSRGAVHRFRVADFSILGHHRSPRDFRPRLARNQATRQ